MMMLWCVTIIIIFQIYLSRPPAVPEELILTSNQVIRFHIFTVMYKG